MSQIRRHIVYLIIALFIVACGNVPPKVPSPEQRARFTDLRESIKKELADHYDLPIGKATPLQLKRGGELYLQLCAACHGTRGGGNGKVVQEGLLGVPTDFTDPAQALFFSEAARLYIIKKGVPGTPMMGWGNILTEDDLISVYKYMRSLIQE